MNIYNVKLVIGELAKTGEAKVLYIGTNFADAEKVYRGAGEEYSSVIRIDHLVHSGIRSPKQEAEQVLERQRQAERQAEVEKNRLVTAANEKRAAAAKAIAEANVATIAANPELRALIQQIDLRKQSAVELREAGALLGQRSNSAGEIAEKTSDKTLKKNSVEERDRLAGEAAQQLAAAGKLDEEIAALEAKLAEGLKNAK